MQADAPRIARFKGIVTINNTPDEFQEFCRKEENYGSSYTEMGQ